MTELFKSAALRFTLFTLGGVILLFAAFSAGMHIGERKSRHLANWPQRYESIFDRDSRMPFPPPMLPGTHGVFGKIISIDPPLLVVQGKDKIEQAVLMTTSTEIRLGRERAEEKDLRTDMEVSVFGAPGTDGQIEARLIRLFTRQ